MHARQAEELDADDYAIGLLLHPNDPTMARRSHVGAIPGDFELLAELHAGLEDGPEAASADVQSPTFERGGLGRPLVARVGARAEEDAGAHLPAGAAPA